MVPHYPWPGAAGVLIKLRLLIMNHTFTFHIADFIKQSVHWQSSQAFTYVLYDCNTVSKYGTAVGSYLTHGTVHTVPYVLSASQPCEAHPVASHDITPRFSLLAY